MKVILSTGTETTETERQPTHMLSWCFVFVKCILYNVADYLPESYYPRMFTISDNNLTMRLDFIY